MAFCAISTASLVIEVVATATPSDSCFWLPILVLVNHYFFFIVCFVIVIFLVVVVVVVVRIVVFI